ncbi:hypothetical protein SAMN05518669_1072 [Variovorax sp. YR634]|uniref:hypothetical protein n=1 Tax=Variovorax sp. YR634 TaxID=1884385 RepID=UPI00089A8CF4|nr:hypothetical protein [Variovorax sp. YR634]SDX81666.1 hypothetical protein SAMN05518669_1072 [Variovorax sp. YR634]
MIGITFIHEANPERLRPIEEDGPDALDDLTVVNMEVMNSLDFTVLCGRSVKWNQGEPAVLLEDLVVVRVAPEALDHVLDGRHADLDSDQLADLNRLRTFVMQHGKEHIWEFATF